MCVCMHAMYGAFVCVCVRACVRVFVRSCVCVQCTKATRTALWFRNSVRGPIGNGKQPSGPRSVKRRPMRAHMRTVPLRLPFDSLASSSASEPLLPLLPSLLDSLAYASTS
jgi:hypothetical protein